MLQAYPLRVIHKHIRANSRLGGRYLRAVVPFAIHIPEKLSPGLSEESMPWIATKFSVLLSLAGRRQINSPPQTGKAILHNGDLLG